MPTYEQFWVSCYYYTHMCIRYPFSILLLLGGQHARHLSSKTVLFQHGVVDWMWSNSGNQNASESSNGGPV